MVETVLGGTTLVLPSVVKVVPEETTKSELVPVLVTELSRVVVSTVEPEMASEPDDDAADAAEDSEAAADEREAALDDAADETDSRADETELTADETADEISEALDSCGEALETGLVVTSVVPTEVTPLTTLVTTRGGLASVVDWAKAPAMRRDWAARRSS